MAVLVLAEHDLGTLSAATARIVAAAEKLGPVDVLVAGQGVSAVAAEAAKLAGVVKVLVAASAALASLSPEAVAHLLARLAEPYSHIAAASASTGRDAIPRLAAKLDLMPITDIVAIHGPTRFDRPIYAGNAIETVSSGQAKHLLTIRASAFRPAASGNNAPIHAIDSDVAAVDAGYAPNDWQVGQTGKIIAPDLYIAIGISGALQHLAGIQGAKKIIAINKDPEAPLMKIADIALVGDLFEVVPQLIEGLKR
jgi:electron transfer flavoprotein alpha subunit